MLYVDIPTAPEMRALIETRADACVSMYVPTTPETQHTDASRISLGNMARAAVAELGKAGINKRRLASIAEALEALRADDDFWAVQARTLAVLVTPDHLHTFRLATRVPETMEIADRFYLKPLLRAPAFDQHAFVLALSTNAVRLVEIFADLPPEVVKVPGMPRDASHAVGRARINDLTQNTRIANDEGQKILLRQYARKVDVALRQVLLGQETPLILAAADPLQAIFRSVASYPGLVAASIMCSPDHLTEGDLAAAARPVLDEHYSNRVASLRELFDVRAGDRRATTDLALAARAATWGAIDTLMVDIAAMQPGSIDQDGGLALSDTADIATYDVIDEIAGRALLSGADVLAVRADDLPGPAPVAALLRYHV